MMDFDGNVGEWQRKVSEGKAGVSRRIAVLETLDIQAGNTFLDIGCGGGHLVKELGTAIGSNGLVVGIDPSPQQIETARALCSSLGNVKLIAGSAVEIPCEDGSFDGVTALQTFEYVEDVVAALAEARRVLKRGYPIAIISILWDHCKFYGAEKQLNEQIFEAFRAHCFHQMLPFDLPPMLSKTGFGSLIRKNLSYVDTSLHEEAPGFYLSKLMALFANAQGVSQDDTQKWLFQLDAADKNQTFGFVNFPVLTVATAI